MHEDGNVLLATTMAKSGHLTKRMIAVSSMMANLPAAHLDRLDEDFSIFLMSALHSSPWIGLFAVATSCAERLDAHVAGSYQV